MPGRCDRDLFREGRRRWGERQPVMQVWKKRGKEGKQKDSQTPAQFRGLSARLMGSPYAKSPAGRVPHLTRTGCFGAHCAQSLAVNDLLRVEPQHKPSAESRGAGAGPAGSYAPCSKILRAAQPACATQIYFSMQVQKGTPSWFPWNSFWAHSEVMVSGMNYSLH